MPRQRTLVTRRKTTLVEAPVLSFKGIPKGPVGADILSRLISDPWVNGHIEVTAFCQFFLDASDIKVSQGIVRSTLLFLAPYLNYAWITQGPFKTTPDWLRVTSLLLDGSTHQEVHVAEVMRRWLAYARMASPVRVDEGPRDLVLLPRTGVMRPFAAMWGLEKVDPVLTLLADLTGTDRPEWNRHQFVAFCLAHLPRKEHLQAVEMEVQAPPPDIDPRLFQVIAGLWSNHSLFCPPLDWDQYIVAELGHKLSLPVSLIVGDTLVPCSPKLMPAHLGTLHPQVTRSLNLPGRVVILGYLSGLSPEVLSLCLGMSHLEVMARLVEQIDDWLAFLASPPEDSLSPAGHLRAYRRNKEEPTGYTLRSIKSGYFLTPAFHIPDQGRFRA